VEVKNRPDATKCAVFEAIKTAETAFFVASSQFFTSNMSTMHGHMNNKSDKICFSGTVTEFIFSNMK
jgi:hypothetical protein